MKRLLLLTLPLLLAGCAKPADDATAVPATPSTTAASDASPDGTVDAGLLPRYHWRLTSATDAQGQRIAALFAQPDKPVQLDFRDGRLAVSNTCNRMGGGYTLAGSTLTTDRLVSTLMACADSAVMALDQEAGKRLEGPLTVVTRGGGTPQLTLTTGNGDALVFTGEPTAETRHGGPGERVFLEVAADTKPCSHPLIPDKQCLQVREIAYDAQGIRTGTPGDFQNFHDSIEGYTHEPGVRNVLRVDRYTVKNPPADASSNAYVLDMVVESATGKQ